MSKFYNKIHEIEETFKMEEYAKILKNQYHIAKGPKIGYGNIAPKVVMELKEKLNENKLSDKDKRLLHKKITIWIHTSKDADYETTLGCLSKSPIVKNKAEFIKEYLNDSIFCRTLQRVINEQKYPKRYFHI